MERDPQLNQPPGSTRPSLFELMNRSTASALVFIYGVGFVILAFNDARYGVVQFSPFRTRIALVGLVFTALVSVTAFALNSPFAYLDLLKSVRSDTDPDRRFSRDGVLIAGFMFTATLMAAVLSLFIFPTLERPPVPTWRVISWVAFYLLCIPVFHYIDRIFTRKPRAALHIAAVTFILYLLVTPLVLPVDPVAQLAIFFALVGVEIAYVKRTGIWNYISDLLRWPIVLAIVWIYISHIFSGLPPRWGGGQLTPVQIFQKSPVPWSPSNPVDALLLDETDQGVYVLLSPNGKAFFVPRSDIASMFFGSKQELTTQH